MQAIQESLYRQAQFYFSAQPLVELAPGISCYLYTPALKENLSKERFYVLLNIYFLEKPKSVLAYIQRHLKSQGFHLAQYLQALRSLSLFFGSNIDKYKHLKQIYRLLSGLEDVKKCMAKDCSIPSDIAETIQGLGKRKKTLIDLQNKNQPILSGKLDERHPHDINLNYSKVVLLFANLKECLSETEFQKIWLNITSMAEKYGLCYLKILDIFVKSLQTNRNLDSCFYILKKLHQVLKGDILRQLTRLLQNEYFEQGQRAVYRKKLTQIQLQKGKHLSVPNQEVFRALSILIKAEIIDFTQVFPLLTPPLKYLTNVEDQRVRAHQQYVKLCFKKSIQGEEKSNPLLLVWGELLNSSKLQLLNHILLSNNLKVFKLIVQKYGIKIDTFYHPNILETLCSLFQWVIDPLYQKTEIISHFKIKRNIQKAFPKGHFRQICEISNQMIDYLSELLQIGKSYLFSSKTTFIKTCRLFKEICTKNSKLPFQQSDINKKIITFISNVIKRHILAAVEYYSKDPSITFQIDRLIDCFKFKIQFEIYNDYLKQGQFSNLHLSFIYQHTTSELTKCLNRLTDTDSVIKKINSLLINNVFSSLYQIFQRLSFIPKDQLRKIIDAMNKTSKFTKKVALFFVFLQMGQHDKEMITSESEVNKKYELLISFTHSLLLFQKKNEEFIKIIFEYFIYKLSTFNSDVKQLSHFELFHGQISFIEGLLQNLLPIQLDECAINQYDRKYLVGGPLLKIKIMNKIKQFNQTRVIRSSIIKSLFKSHLKCIFDNIFYFIILKLNTIQQFILRNLSFNIATTAFLYDKFLKLMLSIINVAHFQTNPAQIDKYFKIKLFQPLVIYYKLPYQISFYIIRKSITEKMAKSKYDWNDPTVWLQLKNYFIPHFKKYFQESKSQLKGFDCENYTEEQVNFFLDFDVFLLFWIQDIQYSLFLSIYTPHINEIEKSIAQNGDKGYEYLEMQYFCQQMKEERDMYAQMHYDLIFENSNCKKLRQEYENKYIIFANQEYDLQEKYTKFCKMFIKYCILPRATLNKSQAYYSWCFYLHFLKKNKLPIQITVKLICLLLEAISRFVPYSTERQSSELLPLLYNTSANIFLFWYNVGKFNDKLQKNLLIESKLLHEDYTDILYILYQSQTRIINYLLENKKEVFSIKNCMTFMHKCQSLPFCSDHGQIIINRFAEIKNRYKQCKDIIAMIQSYSKQFHNKLGLAKSMQNRIRGQSKSNHKSNNVNLLNQTIADISFNEDNFDPLNDYPNLSTEIDFDYADTEENERYSQRSKRSNLCPRQIIFEKQFLPEFSEESSKNKNSKTPSCPKKKEGKPRQAKKRK